MIDTIVDLVSLLGGVGTFLLGVASIIQATKKSQKKRSTDDDFI